MQLEEIVGASTIESNKVECKARLNRENSTGWLKTVAGFANSSGGVLYIGVEDKTDKVIGFNRREADSERNFLNNQINEHIFPRPVCEIGFLRYGVRESTRYIIRATVLESPVKPVVLRLNGVPSIYMRREGFTNGATYEEIIDMSISSTRVSYDAQISTIPYDRNTFSRLFEFHKGHTEQQGRPLTDKGLASLGFMSKDNMLSNGALLFSNSYSGDKTAVQCSVFNGFNRGSERIATINRFRGCITDTLDYMLGFVRQHMNHSLTKTPDGRIGTDSFPPRALFEGIVNAVAHRDYYLDGTQIQIDLFRDRLEISSPGGFYQRGRIERTYDLSEIISKRRNTIICGVLVRCNVMEAAGTGFDKVIEDYAEADEAHRPYIEAASDHFTLTLPDLTYSRGVQSEALPSVEFPPLPSGSPYDEDILSFCFHGARGASDIARHLGISDSSYLRSRIIGNLVDEGYLIKSTAGRGAIYRTSRDFVRLA